MEIEEAYRKFGINLGNFRTEADVLSEIHLKYPWVKVQQINKDGHRIAHIQGPSVPKSKIYQWQGVLLFTPRNNLHV